MADAAEVADGHRYGCYRCQVAIEQGFTLVEAHGVNRCPNRGIDRRRLRYQRLRSPRRPPVVDQDQASETAGETRHAGERLGLAAHNLPTRKDAGLSECLSQPSGGDLVEPDRRTGQLVVDVAGCSVSRPGITCTVVHLACLRSPVFGLIDLSCRRLCRPRRRGIRCRHDRWPGFSVDRCRGYRIGAGCPWRTVSRSLHRWARPAALAGSRPACPA